MTKKKIREGQKQQKNLILLELSIRISETINMDTHPENKSSHFI